MGAISLGVMALATIMAGIGAATPIKGGGYNNWTGFGLVLALLPPFTGPAAAIVGIVALTRSQIKATAHGRRDAAAGVTAGVIAVLLCCVIAALLPSVPKPEGATIRAVTAYNYSLQVARRAA